MQAKRKYKFIANIWIVGTHEGKEILGRTFLRNGQPSATFITENAEAITIDFNDLEKIKKLTLPKLIPYITTTIEHKKRKTFLEKHILETLTLINKQ